MNVPVIFSLEDISEPDNVVMAVQRLQVLISRYVRCASVVTEGISTSSDTVVLCRLSIACHTIP